MQLLLAIINGHWRQTIDPHCSFGSLPVVLSFSLDVIQFLEMLRFDFRQTPTKRVTDVRE
mgnify:CR=1 FL=1